MVEKHRNTESILEDYKNGLSVKEIAYKWSAHDRTVNRIARKYGLPNRKEGLPRKIGFTPKTCTGCCKPYLADRPERLYCSRLCYVKHYVQKKNSKTWQPRCESIINPSST